MNWQELVGSVGGLMGFVSLFASRFVGYFAELQFASYIANRLYLWTKPECIKQVFDAKDGKIGEETEKKEEMIMFLPYMGLRRLWYRAMCGMCDRKRYWNTYVDTLKKVESDMKE
jgi:hypothetical protein